MREGFEKFPNCRDMLILARKWLEKEDLQWEEIKNRLVDFCGKWARDFDELRGITLFDVVKTALESGSQKQNKEQVVFYLSESTALKNIKNDALTRLMFSMMCVAKWKETDCLYFNSKSTFKLSEFFEIAGLPKTTIKKQDMYLHELAKKGLIEIDLKPICRIHLKPIATDGLEIAKVKIDKNIMLSMDEILLDRCCVCGKPIQKVASKQKYCEDCLKEVKRAQKREWWQKNHGN